VAEANSRHTRWWCTFHRPQDLPLSSALITVMSKTPVEGSGQSYGRH